MAIALFFFKQKTAYEIGVRLVGSEMCIRDSARPDPTLAEFETGLPDSGYSSPYRLPDLNHTYPVMALSLIHI